MMYLICTIYDPVLFHPIKYSNFAIDLVTFVSLTFPLQYVVVSICHDILALTYLQGGVVNFVLAVAFPPLPTCSICGYPVQCDSAKLRRRWICLCAPGKGP